MRRLFQLLVFLVVFGKIHCTESLQNQASIVYGTIGAESLHRAFSEHIHIHSNEPNLIGYLEFKQEHPIDEATYLYIKYALNYFKKKKVDFVIVHLNTFGGEIFSAIKIADLFQKFDVNEGIPLIAFIDNYAIASGVILAYACRFIAVTQNSFMGGQLPDQVIKIQSAPEKVMAYLLNEYASLASFYGRDPVPAEVMVDIKMIAVEREGKIVSFYDPSELRSYGDHPDIMLATDKEWLTLDAKKLLKYGIADFEIISDQQFYPNKQEKKQGIWSFDKGFLSKEPYLGSIPNASMIAYKSWKISFLMFLTHPAVASILLIGLIISFYLQIKTGKFNASGATGLICLSLIILTSFAIQSIAWIEVVFLAFGVSLIILDNILVKEGSGSVGFLGIGLTVASLVMLLLPGFEKFSLLDFESYSFAARSLVERMIWLVSSLLLGFIGTLVVKKLFSHRFKQLPKYVPVNKELIKDKDFLQSFEDNELPKENSEGTAHCTLRPFGKVLIRDKIYDAISYENKTILKKSLIVVVKHELGKLVVKQKS
jgi:membrane-bound serine protease (ClpP class)